MKTGKFVIMVVGIGFVISVIRAILTALLFDGVYYAQEAGFVRIVVVYAVFFSTILLVVLLSCRFVLRKRREDTHLTSVEKSGIALQTVSFFFLLTSGVSLIFAAAFHIVMMCTLCMGLGLCYRNKSELSVSLISWVVGFYLLFVII